MTPGPPPVADCRSPPFGQDPQPSQLPRRPRGLVVSTFCALRKPSLKEEIRMALVFSEDIHKLWKNYTTKPTLALRNKLMLMYMPIVKFNADRISAKLPDEVDSDDLMSAGLFGLMDAIDAFEPERLIKFETYCAPRVRGAMLDELRSMDWVPRLVRNRASRLEAAVRGLQAELGRVPTESELASRMGLSKPEFDKLQRDANTVSVVSLSRKYYESDSNREVLEIDILKDQGGIDPQYEQEKRDVVELIGRMTRIEQLVLNLYYHEGMTMKEIGRSLDLSESRVSQMHSAIINQLKHTVEDRQAAMPVGP